MAQESKSRHRQIIGEDDIRRIFDACRDDLERAIWGVGLYTGLRSIDVCNLTYGALDRGLTKITWTPIKTRRHMPNPLEIPIAPPLKSLLTKVLNWSKIGSESAKDEPLWEDYKSRYYNDTLARWFKRTLNKAGLKSSIKDESNHTHVLTGFHITRLAFVTIASKYMSPLLVQKIVGHSSMEMTEHYCQANQDQIRDGISQMPDLTQAQGETKPMTEEESIMNLLEELRDDGESPLECLRRLVANSTRVAC